MADDSLHSFFNPKELVLLDKLVALLLHEDDRGLTHKQLMEHYQKRHGKTIKCSQFGVHKVTDVYPLLSPVLVYDGSRIRIDPDLKPSLALLKENACLKDVRSEVMKPVLTSSSCQTEPVNATKPCLISSSCQTEEEKSKSRKKKVRTEGCQTVTETIRTEGCQTVTETIEAATSTEYCLESDSGSSSPVQYDQERCTSEEIEMEAPNRTEPDGQVRRSPAKVTEDLEILRKMSGQSNPYVRNNDLPNQDLVAISAKLDAIVAELPAIQSLCSAMSTVPDNQSYLVQAYNDSNKVQHACLYELNSLKQVTEEYKAHNANLVASIGSRICNDTAMQSASVNMRLTDLVNSLNALTASVQLLETRTVTSETRVRDDIENSVAKMSHLKLVLKDLVNSLSDFRSESKSEAENIRESLGQISDRMVKIMSDPKSDERQRNLFICRYCKLVPSNGVVLEVGCGGLIGCESCVFENYSELCPRCNRTENYQVLTTAWDTIINKLIPTRSSCMDECESES